MNYGRIETVADLPQAGPPNARAREKVDIDFKTFAEAKKMAEHAKDVAALANALGGALIIGADDDQGVVAYPGLKGQTVPDVKRTYEDAGVLCSPAQNVDVIPIQVGAVWVVAANVEPSVDHIVGAPTLTTPPGWRFPIRRASLTDYVDPENLPMYMNQAVRRAHLLLRRIPTDQHADFTVYFPRVDGAHEAHLVTVTYECRLDEVTASHVVITRGSFNCKVPLADVMDVYERVDGKWAMKLNGVIDGQPDRPITYKPRFSR